MTNTFLPDPDREELDLLLRGFQVSRMLRLLADLWIGDKVRTNGHITLPIYRCATVSSTAICADIQTR